MCVCARVCDSAFLLQALVGRLKEFILRFNAQCDSLDPRPREWVREGERDCVCVCVSVNVVY